MTQDPLSSPGDPLTAAAATLANRPDDLGALVTLAAQRLPRGFVATARAWSRRLAEAVPQGPEAWLHLGNATLEALEPLSVARAFAIACVLVPDAGAPWSNLSVAAREANRLASARINAQRAVRLEPTAPHWLNLGVALGRSLDDDQAARAFDAASSLAPGDPRPRFNRAEIDLRDGDLARGVRDYEARLDLPQIRAQATAWPAPLLPRDVDPRGRHVPVVAEQGFGDTLQFSRLALILVRHGARVTLAVPPRRWCDRKI